MSLRKFIGLFQVGFLDLATGAFIADALSKTFHAQSASLLLLALGAALAVLPDIDLFDSLGRRKPLDLTHRNTVFHSPLILLVLPAIVLSFFSSFWTLVWALPILFHYLHDTIDNFGGIAWFSPFSKTKFAVSLFGKKLLIRRAPRDPGLTLDQALEKKYYRLTLTSLFEAIVPTILLVIIALTYF